MKEDTKNIQKRLAKIQQSLKVAKNQRNNFGNYNYRSCEDILEAVKPLLNGCTLIISDEVVNVGERYYVKATAYLGNGKSEISVSAYAREAEEQKGMSPAQITGSASSYARKYALGGLFAIDDTKDADTMDNSTQKETPKTVSRPAQEEMNLGVCKKCGASNLMSQSRNVYCSAKCWLVKKE